MDMKRWRRGERRVGARLWCLLLLSRLKEKENGENAVWVELYTVPVLQVCGPQWYQTQQGSSS